jgi:hypothetical protein
MPNITTIAHVPPPTNEGRSGLGEILSSILQDIIATRATVRISDECMICYGTIIDMDVEAIEIQVTNKDGQRLIVPRSTISMIRDLGRIRRRFPFSSQRYRYRLRLNSRRNTIG